MRPLVVSESGWPHCVCSRCRRARSSTGNDVGAGPGFVHSRSQSRPRILNLWHRQLAAYPRVPNTASRSAQLASFAGTITTSGVIGAAPSANVREQTRRTFEVARIEQRCGEQREVEDDV